MATIFQKTAYVLLIQALVISVLLCKSAVSQEVSPKKAAGSISVVEFLPESFKEDGTVSYQQEIQQAINYAAAQKRVLVFPPMIYLLDEKGLQLRSHLTLLMHGAIFQLWKECAGDGQAFSGKDLNNVYLKGGEIRGCLGEWAEGINIRGIYMTGQCENIRITDMLLHDLTSNAIGIFGSPEEYASDVRVDNIIAEDGCNYYGDYLSEKPGPEEGSLREDQGLIAFYYVRDFIVQSCRFSRSRSDGTHFYKSKHGQFVQNKVYASQMGGYFLEGCEEITAADNIILDNGSRGVTIERGSRNCLLNGNIVKNSGREGLWAPNSTGLVINGNIFVRNGRKPNGPKESQIWNANITINDAHDPTKTVTRDYLITNNIFYTGQNQIAAMRVDSEMVRNITIKNNQMMGENKRVLVEGEAAMNVVVENNE